MRFERLEHVEHRRLAAHDEVFLQNLFIEDVAAEGVPQKFRNVFARRSAPGDLLIQAVAVDDARHFAVVVHQQRFLLFPRECFRRLQQRLIREHGRELFDFERVGDAGRVADLLFDRFDGIHHLVARVGNEQLAARRAVHDGVAQLSIIDELVFVAANRDVQVGTAFDQIGKVLRRSGAV